MNVSLEIDELHRKVRIKNEPFSVIAMDRPNPNGLGYLHIQDMTRYWFVTATPRDSFADSVALRQPGDIVSLSTTINKETGQRMTGPWNLSGAWYGVAHSFNRNAQYYGGIQSDIVLRPITHDDLASEVHAYMEKVIYQTFLKSTQFEDSRMKIVQILSGLAGPAI